VELYLQNSRRKMLERALFCCKRLPASCWLLVLKPIVLG
jgi:hypothetical protein